MCSSCGKPLGQVPPASVTPPTVQQPAPQPTPAPVGPAQPAPHGWAGQGPPPAAPPPAPPKKRSLFRRVPLWLWILIGLTVVALVVLAVFLLWPEDEEAEPTAMPTATQTAVVEVSSTAEPTTIATVEEPTATPTPEEPTATPAAESPTAEPNPPANLLQNGDFSQEWTAGWQQAVGGETSGNRVVEVIELEGERTVHLEHTGPSWLEIRQQVPVNPALLRLSTRIKLSGETIDAAAGRMGVGALMLIYHGADPAAPPLGYSLWLNGERREFPLLQQAPFPPPGSAIAWHWTGEDWFSLELDLREEIVNRLLVVNPDDVQHITVVLLVAGGEACTPTECLAEVYAAGILLTQE